MSLIRVFLTILLSFGLCDAGVTGMSFYELRSIVY
jgi:hypothetical protein